MSLCFLHVLSADGLNFHSSFFLYACEKLKGQTLILDQMESTSCSNTILIGILSKWSFLLIPKDIEYYK